MRLILRARDIVELTLKSRRPVGAPTVARVVRVTPHYVSVKILDAPIAARLQLYSYRMGEVIRITDHTAQSRVRG